ncbi:hypothetical protein KIPB_008319 [Kipferlia bialata]|uniref:O-antigen ligase-related domain-containing protein n=1 Tax=Kipferlia bialata TaxID=797122 RepID=A0A9K3D0F1_9EUKA|nr:hypothetical protein KIPB_008319 [Kipferlia bialata]|eukprot:g8319.t1
MSFPPVTAALPGSVTPTEATLSLRVDSGGGEGVLASAPVVAVPTPTLSPTLRERDLVRRDAVSDNSDILGSHLEEAPKARLDRVLKLLRTFADSFVFKCLCLVIGGVYVWLDMPVQGVTFFVILCSVLFILCDSAHPTLLPFLMISTVPLKEYDSWDEFLPLWKLAPTTLFSLVFHYTRYWKRKDKVTLGPTFKGLVAISFALCVGGIGVLTLAEYFNPLTLYYTLGLGVGMTGVYCLFTKDARGQRDSFVTSVVLWGLFPVYMLAQNYVPNWQRFVDGGYSILDIQMSNNASTILCITMPLCFYVASKHFTIGVSSALLMTFGLVISSSRSGLVFACVMYPMCALVFMVVDRRHRVHHAVSLVLIIAVCFVYRAPLLSSLDRLIHSITDADIDGEIRALMVDILWETIGDYWLVGHGIGFTGLLYLPKDGGMYWYHNAAAQILGSMGVVGCICYTIEMVIRVWLCVIRKGSIFAVAVFGSYGFLTTMSMANPGIFCPIPYAMILVHMMAVLEQDTSPRVKGVCGKGVPHSTDSVLSVAHTKGIEGEREIEGSESLGREVEGVSLIETV